MPKITSSAKLFRDWEALLGACDKNTGLLAGMESLKAELETLLAQGKEVKLQQESLNGNKKAVTQNFRQIESQGQEVARKLRAFVLSRIGTKTELGKMFGLVPTGRKRKAKNQVVKGGKPPAPEPSGKEEEAPRKPDEP